MVKSGHRCRYRPVGKWGERDYSRRKPRNRWRRNIQAISYRHPDIDFLRELEESLKRFVSELKPENWLRAFNAACLYSESAHISRDLESRLESVSEITPERIREYFSIYKMNKEPETFRIFLLSLFVSRRYYLERNIYLKKRRLYRELNKDLKRYYQAIQRKISEEDST